MRTDVRQLTGHENSTFVTDSELTRRINLSIAALYDMLVEIRGDVFYAERSSITATASTAVTAVGSTSSAEGEGTSLHRIISMEVTLNGEICDIRPLPDWRTRLLFPTPTGWSDCQSGPYYSLENDSTGMNVRWWPTPTATHTVTMTWIPTALELSADGDTFDGINGWEDWVIHDVGVYVLQKEESDASVLMAERSKIEARVRKLAVTRDHGHPRRVVDSRSGRRTKTGGSDNRA
jgi:hypothetical protein